MHPDILKDIIKEAGYTPIKYDGNIAFFSHDSFLMSLSRLIHEANLLDNCGSGPFRLDQMLDIMGAENIKATQAGVGIIISFPYVKWEYL